MGLNDVIEKKIPKDKEIMEIINKNLNDIRYNVSSNSTTKNGENLDRSIFRYLSTFFIIASSIPLSRFLSQFILRKVSSNSRNKIYLDLLVSILRYTIIFIAIIVSLKLINLDTTAVFGALGIVGIGISLAFQQYMKDFVAGFFLIFFDYFRNGDLIEVNNILGNVREFRFFSTSIESKRNSIYDIPNSALWNNNFRNLSRTKKTTLEIQFLVSNRNNLKDIVEVTTQAIRKYTDDKNPIVTFLPGKDFGTIVSCYILVTPDKYMHYLHSLPVKIKFLLQENNFIFLDGVESSNRFNKREIIHNDLPKYRSQSIDPIII